jgi:hypothetical protein
VLGPVVDQASRVDPEHFGPYALAVVARSADQSQGNGVWLFQTSTGGPEDVLDVPLVPGLDAIALHNVLFSGAEFEVPFSVTLTAMRVPRRVAGRLP